ncbi:hypothetical protein F5Y08DRAFT_343893 [Xylaria arbuscula]|nr:hypothetical protein F5Y08DRAFT_343893 [Xylaria arbuscula]
MCIISVLRSHSSDDEPAPAQAPDSDTSFCLFGMHCAQIKHTHFLYLDGEQEICPGCDVRSVLQTVLWSVNASKSTPLTIPDPFYWEDRKPPLTSTTEAWNTTAQRELTWLLSKKDISFVHCKFILHYILGLPYFIEREPLLKIFGEKVGSWCGYQAGVELRGIAREHFWDGELEVALHAGFKGQMRLREMRGKEEGGK